MTEILWVLGPFAFFATAILFAGLLEVVAMTFEYILGGVLAGLGIAYLVYVLIWPEKF